MCICITYFFFIFYIFICHSICFPSFLFMSVRFNDVFFCIIFKIVIFIPPQVAKKVDIKMILSKYGLIPSFYCVYNLHFSDTFLDYFFFFYPHLLDICICYYQLYVCFLCNCYIFYRFLYWHKTFSIFLVNLSFIAFIYCCIEFNCILTDWWWLLLYLNVLLWGFNLFIGKIQWNFGYKYYNIKLILIKWSVSKWLYDINKFSFKPF